MTKLTTKFALPYPDQSQSANVPADMKLLADRLDVVIPTLPAVKPNLLSALGTASAALTLGTAVADVAGMTCTINVPATTSVFIICAVFDFHVAISPAVGRAIGVININGVDRAPRAIFGQDKQPVNTEGTVCVQDRITGLAVGNRIFKGRAYASAASSHYRAVNANSTIAVWQVS